MRVAGPVRHAAPADRAARVVLQISLPVSGSSAKTVEPPVTYMMPSIDERRDLEVRCTPVSNVHACCSVATFAGVICVSGENRCAPGSASGARASRRRLSDPARQRGSDRRDKHQSRSQSARLMATFYKLQSARCASSFRCLGIAVAACRPAVRLLARRAGAALRRSSSRTSRIIDGSGAAPIERGRIVIQGDRITAVGSGRYGRGARQRRAFRPRRPHRSCPA